MRKRILRSFPIFVLVVIFSTSLLSATAQQGNTTTYVYDANGRLHAVISPAGEAVVYEYDAAGNITAVRRMPATALAIFDFSPRAGIPGDQVTFTGIGFGGGVNDVSFNGASATIVSVTPTKVVAVVPPAATTGLVTITTPTGSVSTATPFTIAGLRVTPSTASVKFGESVQFVSEVLPATIDQTVEWSVEGVVGGNASIGTISADGVYTAPNTRFSGLTIRATSVADNTRSGEARVTVNDPNDIQSVFAPAVSVQRGISLNKSAVARPVAVQFGIASLSAAIARPISVQRGTAATSAAIARPVSVRFNDFRGWNFPDAVSVTAGPYIQSISPGSFSRGTSTSVTINGVGLTGATALRFIMASGSIDTSITVSNISVSPDGSSLTATITVSAGSALGSRFVIIATPNGDSIRVDVEVNRINVQ
ncbi:MAG TPA: RHS repeat domain-containing protein [Pyrinomonadaceae bacterium]|nr:RHS repeat domain-containing protein [Pyrinomonadaceae bacterium]